MVIMLSAGNSILSYRGYPVKYYGCDIYSMGMGDAGSSDIFRVNTGFSNPAMNHTPNRGLFSTGLLFGYSNYETNSGISRKYRDNSFDFPYFSISIPYYGHRLGFQFNSYASGVVENQTSFSSGDLTIIEKQTMDRYLYRVDAIYSYAFKRLKLGLGVNYYFGHDTQEFSQFSESGIFNTWEKLTNSYKNPTATLGAIWGGDKFALGTYYTLSGTLKGEQKRSFGTNGGSWVIESETNDEKYKIPEQIGVSATILPMDEYKLAADVIYEPSGKSDFGDQDGWKLALGLAREPSQERKNWFSRLPVRTGISYRRLQFNDQEDNALNEISATLGLSFNLKKDLNRIDVGVKLTRRGEIETNKMQDTAVMMMLGITGFDIFSRESSRREPRYIPVKEELAE